MSESASPNRIEMLRTMAGLRTPADLAEVMGVHERTVYRWERGEVQIPDEQKLALADYFKVTVAFLMGWPEAPNGNGVEVAA